MRAQVLGRFPFWTFGFLSSLLWASGCGFDDDDPEDPPPYCYEVMRVTGTLGGQPLTLASEADPHEEQTYRTDAGWHTLKGQIKKVDANARAQMEGLGLDPNDAEDAASFLHLTQGHDFAITVVADGQQATVGPSLTLHFYNLESNRVQPGDSIEVFDLSGVVQVTDDQSVVDTSALRARLELLHKSKAPSVVIALSLEAVLDRREVPLVRMPIDAVFARGGIVKLVDFHGLSGEAMSEVNYPPFDWNTFDVRADGISFEAGNVSIQLACLNPDISAS